MSEPQHWTVSRIRGDAFKDSWTIRWYVSGDILSVESFEPDGQYEENHYRLVPVEQKWVARDGS